LDSGEFEEWASLQLTDPQSPVNIRGMEVAEKIAGYAPTYYWWFQDVGVEGFAPLTECPKCSASLTEVGWALGCEKCCIFVANEGE
jgi:predicted  nucleic acid-binding Zn ribbon protein